MKRVLIVLSILSLGIVSCKKTDKTKPTVSIISPAEGTTVIAGQNIIFDLLMFDEGGLSQVKIDIHDDFNGHGHKSTIIPFSKIQVENLSGTEISRQIEVFIPDTAAAGPYHVSIEVVDLSGNLSVPLYREIIIKNLLDTIAPQLTIDSPVNGQTVNAGASIQFKGQATDNILLRKLEYSINRVGSDNKLAENVINFSLAQESFDIQIPLSASVFSSGSYELTCILYDNIYNAETKLISFTFN